MLLGIRPSGWEKNSKPRRPSNRFGARLHREKSGETNTHGLRLLRDRQGEDLAGPG